MNYLSLPYPHGFLIWRGKQTAIASSELLDGEKFLIVTGDDAFGEATLGKPAAMTVDIFETKAEKHCIKPFERKLFWPEAQSLYVYPVKKFNGFEEPVLFQDGQIVNYKPTADEQKMIDQASDLPKTIIIDSEAVSIGGDFDIADVVKDNDDLKRVLEAIYGTEVSSNDNKSLPVYQLALIRNPKLIVKKKEVEEEKQTMPWEIKERFEDCSGFAVVKVEDDSIAGCHETQEEAEAQLTALVLSEEEENAEDVEEKQPEDKQEEGLEIAEGFAIIDIESGDVLSCHPSLEAAEEVLAELTEETEETEEENEAEKAGKRLNGAMLKRLKDAWGTIKDMIAWGEYKENKEFLTEDYGIAVKKVDGELWHFTWSTNAFRDRQEEIFSTKALENYVIESSQKEDRGFFNFWHIPGTDFAEKRFQEVVGRFLVEAGPYLKNEAGKKAQEFFKQFKGGHPEFAPEGWGCSPEFKFLPEERNSGVFDWLWITRTSTLPKSEAANIWTESSQEVKMTTLTGERKDAAIAVFDKDFITNLLKEGEKRTEDLEDAGIAHKEETGKEETKSEEFTLEQVVTAITEKMNVDMKPIAEAILTMEENQKALQVDLESLKKTKAIKEETEMPRFLFQAIRAKEAKATQVADDDELKDKKPEETQKKDVSLSGHFFNGGK